jgi:hypothetical protein
MLDNIKSHEILNHIKKTAVPKREEGIGRLRKPPHSKLTHCAGMPLLHVSL